MSALGYYPGCSLEGTSREYNESVESLAKLFGIELRQVPDWNCCGATAAHNLNKALALALPARILALAAAAGMESLLVPCAACYNRLAVTVHELSADSALRAEVEQAIGMETGRLPRIMNVIEFIQEQIMPRLSEKQIKDFAGKVACYYGCLLVRPHEVLKFDRQEDPRSMDEIMAALGAQSVEWPFKTECCGASLSVTQSPIATKLSGRIVKEAMDRGAEAIIVACPMCQSNLDLRRSAIDGLLGRKTGIPVLYITQAIGLVCGLDDKQTGTRRHIVKVDWKRMTQPKQETVNEETN